MIKENRNEMKRICPDDKERRKIVRNITKIYVYFSREKQEKTLFFTVSGECNEFLNTKFMLKGATIIKDEENLYHIEIRKEDL